MRVGMCGALGVTAPSLATCGPVKACVEPCMCQPVPMGVPGPTVRHHCEALRAERSPDPWILHSCWSSVDSAVQTPGVFWLCCLGLSTLKRPSSQTSHGSPWPCITPQRMFLEDRLSQGLFGLRGLKGSLEPEAYPNLAALGTC